MVPEIAGTYNVTVKVESVDEPVFHKFTVISKESDSEKRRIGWTPAFEYHRVQVNGTDALQICSLLDIACPENPVFDAVNRHDKNYTYFYYDLPDKEYLVILDDANICYTTDDVDFESTGMFEKCITAANTIPKSEVLCLQPRGIILDENCQRIGKYDLQTGIPITENQIQCDLLEGTWYDKQNKCDSPYAPLEYRFQFGYSSLGYEIHEVCTDDIMIHLTKFSNLFDKGFDGSYEIHHEGLPNGVTQEKFQECVDFIYEKQILMKLENKN